MELREMVNINPEKKEELAIAKIIKADDLLNQQIPSIFTRFSEKLQKSTMTRIIYEDGFALSTQNCVKFLDLTFFQTDGFDKYSFKTSFNAFVINTDSTKFANTYTRLSGYRNTTGQTGATFEYSISGTWDDYLAQKLGLASILIELGSHSYHQFERNQQAMWAMVRS